jgi:hypothetical protein
LIAYNALKPILLRVVRVRQGKLKAVQQYWSKMSLIRLDVADQLR